MSEWLKMLLKVPEIVEKMIKYWEKYDTPRNQENLKHGREVLEKVLEHWFLLRNEGIRPNAAERILARALQISKENIDSAVERALKEWENYEDKDWEFKRKFSSPKFYMASVSWYLDSYVKVPKKPSAERGRPRKTYPIEEMKRLREEEGLSYGEIAKRLGIPKTTVYRLLKSVRVKQSEQG